MANKRWWIGSSTFNWFDSLHCSSCKESDKQNWQGLIYFDKEKDAKEFEKNLKHFIKENYLRAKDEGWFPEIEL